MGIANITPIQSVIIKNKSRTRFTFTWLAYHWKEVVLSSCMNEINNLKLVLLDRKQVRNGKYFLYFLKIRPSFFWIFSELYISEIFRFNMELESDEEKPFHSFRTFYITMAIVIVN